MIRKLLLGLVSGTLALGVMAAPVSAQPVAPAGALEINAIPGVAIDICHPGRQLVRGLRYSKADQWDTIVPIRNVWKVRKAAKKPCTGKKLGKFAYTFEPGETYTIIYWMPKKEVVMSVRKNQKVSLDPGKSTLRVHHAAKAKAIDTWIWQSVPAPAAIKIGPTFNALGRGKVSKYVVIDERFTVASVFPDKRTSRWRSESAVKNLDAGYGYQLVLMGTTRKNMKLKFYRYPDY